jgi:hypothetical protein
MSLIEVRPFRRSDREQLTQLVNAHAAAVVPGMSASVSAVLSALERQPGEFIEDRWVSERVTLVAGQQDRIAAAAHLLRYFPDERAGTSATCGSPSRTGGVALRPGCSGRPLTGCAWQTSTGSWTTPGSKAPTPAGLTTQTTARSFPQWDFGNSPAPSEDGPGRCRRPDKLGRPGWFTAQVRRRRWI